MTIHQPESMKDTFDGIFQNRIGLAGLLEIATIKLCHENPQGVFGRIWKVFDCPGVLERISYEFEFSDSFSEMQDM